MDYGIADRLEQTLPSTSQPTEVPAQDDLAPTMGVTASAPPNQPDSTTELPAASVNDTDQGPAAVAMSSQQSSATGPPAGLSTIRRRKPRMATWISIAICAALLIGAAVPVALRIRSASTPASTQQIRYIGVYERDMASSSYTGVARFTTETGTKPDILMYYSSWLEQFPTSFATVAAAHSAMPFVQINPYNVSLAAIAAGNYDGYLTAYAETVRAYMHPVILSFGHEMNGNWYPWGNTHTSSATFVAAWQHIVTVFRGLGVRNVIWLWTVNIIDNGGIPPPTAWWPGSSYVTWVGIDGYYYQSSWTFASLFGPTIAAVREFTHDPILIAETGAVAGATQATNVADLFAGVRLYGLFGFVWFDAKANHEDWRLSGPGAFAAFRQGAKTYHQPRQ